MTFYTKLIGIINITPDSISSRFRQEETEKILQHIDFLFASGASIVDIGAESSNPNSREISTEEEVIRLSKILNPIFDAFPGKIFSLDTGNALAAYMFLEMGGAIINDYTGLTNDSLIDLVRTSGCLYIVTHFPGRSIQEVHTREKINSLDQVRDDLLARKQYLVERGVREEQIILDPGIGFGKSAELNWELLSFKSLVPTEKVCIGYSKKGFLGEDRGERAINKYAGELSLKTKPDYIRLHDPQILSRGEQCKYT